MKTLSLEVGKLYYNEVFLVVKIKAAIEHNGQTLFVDERSNYYTSSGQLHALSQTPPFPSNLIEEIVIVFKDTYDLFLQKNLKRSKLGLKLAIAGVIMSVCALCFQIYLANGFCSI